MFQHIRSLKKLDNVGIVTWVNEAQYFRKKIIHYNNYDEI